ncbi:hypothetical protein IEQ34_016518 [Dendrobium chrysotoxum]|uniref:Protein transport protein SEC23 n=1 Tax=Dendrobium chrysotoxum TaxID=161865 RepID=A0AAV7GG05_DENCH|nr:hypothetical protein IEQ34_016518 [Dendrobium chrysotoxum]
MSIRVLDALGRSCMKLGCRQRSKPALAGNHTDKSTHPSLATIPAISSSGNHTRMNPPMATIPSDISTRVPPVHNLGRVPHNRLVTSTAICARACPSLRFLPTSLSFCILLSAASLLALPSSTPFCRIDFPSRIWIYLFGFSQNHFPHYYTAISERNVPGVLYLQCSTIKYAIPTFVSGGDPSATPSLLPPIFLFVIDTCVIEELGFVKSAMHRAIGLIPENALVGLITYGTQVQLNTVNPLAKSLGLLKQVPDIIEHTNILKPRFDAINNLIRVMLDVTKCIIEFTELPSEYIYPESPKMGMAMTHNPTAIY